MKKAGKMTYRKMKLWRYGGDAESGNLDFKEYQVCKYSKMT